MKVIKLIIAIFFVVSTTATAEIVKSSADGRNYLYSESNAEECFLCQNKTKDDYEEVAGPKKCPICHDTKKMPRALDFKKVTLNKSKITLELCTIEKVAFPVLKIRHSTGIKTVKVSDLPAPIVRALKARIQQDRNGNYYLLHDAALYGETRGRVAMLYPQNYRKVPIKGKRKIKIEKDIDDNYYYEQKMINAEYANENRYGRCIPIKTNLINILSVRRKIANKKYIWVIVRELVKEYTFKDWGTLRVEQTRRGLISHNKSEVNAEVLTPVSDKISKKILDGEIQIQNNYEI
ncbi:hypothetical protein AAEX28_09545 [Lentisphaerota bacterium WC36G]|nr:hypothetical protein LJT99_12385 [Lentisphaerae bacterium WC36]